jgi:hypothetical protein
MFGTRYGRNTEKQRTRPAGYRRHDNRSRPLRSAGTIVEIEERLSLTSIHGPGSCRRRLEREVIGSAPTEVNACEQQPE